MTRTETINYVRSVLTADHKRLITKYPVRIMISYFNDDSILIKEELYPCNAKRMKDHIYECNILFKTSTDNIFIEDAYICSTIDELLQICNFILDNLELYTVSSKKSNDVLDQDCTVFMSTNDIDQQY